MTQFIYTHHQGSEGKMVEKATMEEPVESSSLNYKMDYEQHINSRQTITAIGFSPSDNGKTFGENGFQLEYQIGYEKHPDEPMYWAKCTKQEFDEANAYSADTRIIAVPLSEKREEDTHTFGKLIAGKMLSNNVDSIPGISEKTQIEITTDNYYPNSIPVVLCRNMLRLLDIPIEDAVKSMYKTFEQLEEKKKDERSKMKGRLIDYSRDLWENKESLDKYINHLKEISTTMQKREERTQDELWEEIFNGWGSECVFPDRKWVINQLKSKYKINLK